MEVRQEIKSLLNNKIFKAGSWYTVANFLSKGIIFITIPIFTRILSTSDYGIVSLFTAWLSIFTIIIGLGLNESIRRAKYEYTEVYDQFVSSITFLSVLIFLTYLCLFIIFKDFFITITQLPEFLFYFMVSQAFFIYIQNFALTKYQVEYKYKIVSLINVSVSISGVLLSILFIYSFFIDERYYGKIIGDGALRYIIGFIFLVILLKNGKRLINLKYWKFALVLGIPLVFHALGLIINAQFDRIIINKYWGFSATGIYSFAYQVGMIIQVLFISIDQAWNPWFFEKFKENSLSMIRARAKIIRNIFTGLYTLVLMISPELIRLMADESYWDGLYIVPWIFMANYFFFIYALEVNVEYACKRTGLIAVGTILSSLINIGLNLIFVPIYGYIAAAITTTISFYILFLFHYLITSKVLKKTVYGFVFHMQSTIYVLVITGYFLVFQDSLIFRIIGVFLFSAILIKLTFLKRP